MTRMQLVATEVVCDGCGATTEAANFVTPPEGWAHLTVKVIGAEDSLDLCPECFEKLPGRNQLDRPVSERLARAR